MLLRRFREKGPRLFTARWNPAGVRMVYTASSLSLALVETFVPLDASQEPGSLVSIEALLPVEEAAVESLEVKSPFKRLEAGRSSCIAEAGTRVGEVGAFACPDGSIGCGSGGVECAGESGPP